MTRPRSSWRIRLISRPLRRLASAAGRAQEAALRRPGGLVLAIVVVTAALGAAASRLEIDNRIERWESDTRGSSTFEFRDFVAIVERGVDAESTEFVARDRDLSARLALVPGVSAVESVSGILDRLGVERPSDLGSGVDYFEGDLLAANGTVVVTRAWLEPELHRPPIVAAIRDAIATTHHEATLVGPAAFNATLDERSTAAGSVAFPLALAGCALIAALAFGSILLAAGLVGTALVGIVWGLGALGALGATLDFVTINVPIVALVVFVALAVHPLRHLTAGPAASELGTSRLRRVTIRTLPGNALAAVTTAIGFLVLRTAPVAPVRAFGLYAAICVLVVLVAHIATLPILARIAAMRLQAGSAGRSLAEGTVQGAVSWSRSHRGIVVGLIVAASAAIVPAVADIEIDHDPFELFAPGDPLRVAYEEIARDVPGTAPLEIEVELTGETRDVWSVLALRRLAAVVSSIEERTGTSGVRSAVDAVRLASSRLPGPRFPGLGGGGDPLGSDLRLAAAAAVVRSIPEMQHFARDGRYRVIVPLPPLSGSEFARILPVAMEAAEAPGEVHAAPTGLIHSIMSIQDRLLTSQVRGLVLAVAGVSAVLGLTIASLRAALSIALTNLLPLGLTVLIMSLADVPLDLSSAMVASVALGIAVDDSAHVLWAAENRRGDPFVAVGAPLVVTSVLLASGFFAFAAVDFPPMRRFGWLTGTTLLLSLVSHLFVLPVCLPSRGRPVPRAHR